MSRSGYDDDDYDQWANIRWRGAVNSAINGKRGQAFLMELISALDALPEKKLVANELEMDGQVCTLGAIGRARGIDMKNINPEDCCTVANNFGISQALAREIMFMNDDVSVWELSDARFSRMRRWIESLIKKGDDNAMPRQP